MSSSTYQISLDRKLTAGLANVGQSTDAKSDKAKRVMLKFAIVYFGLALCCGWAFSLGYLVYEWML
jgi:hypothetical protein